MADLTRKTANLFPVSSFTGKSYTVLNNFNSVSETIEFLPNTQYTISLGFSSELQTGVFKITFVYIDETSSSSEWLYGTTHRTLTSNAGKTVSSISLTDYAQYVDVAISDIMLNAGSTALPYEPYGYKIPISANSTALSPVYLTEQLMKIGNTVDSLVSSGTVTYNIKKLVFDGTENWRKANGGYFFVENAPADYSNQTLNVVNSMWTHFVGVANRGNGSNLNNGEACFYGTQTPTVTYKETYIKYNDASTADDFKAFLAQEYANGTPVTVWYILETPTTETVTAPSIPTIDGANSISIGTTVQPSEFSATWTGWHDASVQEYELVDLMPQSTIDIALGQVYSPQIYIDADSDTFTLTFNYTSTNTGETLIMLYDKEGGNTRYTFTPSNSGNTILIENKSIDYLRFYSAKNYDTSQQYAATYSNITLTHTTWQ